MKKTDYEQQLYRVNRSIYNCTDLPLIVSIIIFIMFSFVCYISYETHTEVLLTVDKINIIKTSPKNNLDKLEYFQAKVFFNYTAKDTNEVTKCIMSNENMKYNEFVISYESSKLQKEYPIGSKIMGYYYGDGIHCTTVTHDNGNDTEHHLLFKIFSIITIGSLIILLAIILTILFYQCEKAKIVKKLNELKKIDEIIMKRREDNNI